jgi:hypothetical protein
VPLPTDFSAHLAAKRQPFSQSMDPDTIDDFFHVVLDETDPKVVSNFFGSFRH